ncbi:MAG: CRISPR-associated helicase Cas3' [Firmicutes bacterium]|nr:CRISPR-associated helicase Cas3' [Alicyclobacillaceae bacterium]MCL6498047.1 CRISPR-associated helicase Cas3' [Bacillota bacterium]
MVVPLDQCWARPPRGDRELLLVDHLEQVAVMASRGATGQEAQALYAAGLLHDIGKARTSWQEYIRRNTGRSVNHAFLGAALFFWCWSRPRVARPEQWATILQLTRDIANHHGSLDDLREEPPWLNGWQSAAFGEVDWPAVATLLRQRCPYLPPIPTDPQTLQAEFRKLPGLWQRWLEDCTDYDLPLDEAVARSIRVHTACLIQADRFDAAAMAPDPGITAARTGEILANIRQYVEQQLDDEAQRSPMTWYRQRMAQEVLSRLSGLEARSSRLWTLELPTGAGKTLLALQVATTLLQKQGGGRMVYVAPYLSVLAQAADVVTRATGIEVLEHHHMASLTPQTDEILRDEDVLIQESWQAPIVATTFNQFFRALFPVRAHEAMRLQALQHAVVIIDEPQVINPSAWAVFLKGLEQSLEILNSHAILTTATLPPLRPARLRHPPITLGPATATPPLSRYQLHVETPGWTTEDVGNQALEELQTGTSCAVMLNTIRDAAEVYQFLLQRAEGCNLYLVTGAMSGIHKRFRLSEIFHAVNAPTHPPKKVLVVSTQVLEAGVDLSFDAILRARSWIPSIVQSAGRVNRHGERPGPGRLRVFTYIRPDGHDSRPFVYRDSVAREETDRLLDSCPVVDEHDIPRVLETFYRAYFQRHSFEGTLQKFVQAANGQWSAVGGLEPFEADVPAIPVFIGLLGPTLGDQTWADAPTLQGLRYFQCQTPDTVFERYTDPKFLSRLDFATRKYFMSLLLRFCVNMPIRRILQQVERFENRVVVRWVDLAAYRPDTGLAEIFISHEDGGAVFL